MEVRTTASLTLGPDCNFALKGWHIWVIWGRSKHATRLCVVALHFVLYLTKTGVLIAGIFIYLNHGPHAFVEDSTQKHNVGKLGVVVITIQALQSIQQAVAFCLIDGRIMVEQYHIIRVRNPSTQPTSLLARLMEFCALSIRGSQSSNQRTSLAVAMLTESYALSTIISTATIFTTPAIASKSGIPGVLIIKMMCRYVEIISYYILLYRVLSRRAWRPDTEQELPDLKFEGESADFTHSVVEGGHRQSREGPFLMETLSARVN
ncbi:hypothetical protein NP233_g3749 [Leucocoprinus birnbaumii]|uniref:Uncharacterized protein n=1 Tax=Leucocoprinus birnbaumii TaxID=56174 RepID=A0AAD5W2J8_9AGAR|nr:hypothetical protein NP233_g3749 [Leucocoprinus birnbaumii]